MVDVQGSARQLHSGQGEGTGPEGTVCELDYCRVRCVLLGSKERLAVISDNQGVVTNLRRAVVASSGLQ